MVFPFGYFTGLVVSQKPQLAATRDVIADNREKRVLIFRISFRLNRAGARRCERFIESFSAVEIKTQVNVQNPRYFLTIRCEG